MSWARSGKSAADGRMRWERWVGRCDSSPNIILEIQPALAEIARQMPHVNEVVVQGNALPEFQMHCPLMSLANVFVTMLNSVPTNVPYIKSAISNLKSLPDTTGKKRVGI